MRILLVGDLHLRAFRLREIADAWGRVVGWAHANGVDVIVQLGDVFERPNPFGKEADVGTVYGAFLDPYRQHATPCRTVLLAGNHDMGGPREKDALTPFDTHSWMTIAHKPEVFKVNDELAICAVPWVNRATLMSRMIDKGMPVKQAQQSVAMVMQNLMAAMAKAVDEHKKKGRFVLFAGHIEVTGAKHEGKSQSDGMFEFATEDLLSTKCDAYALAHIHLRQHLEGLPNPNDGYVGLLSQLSFDEQDYPCGCRLIDVESGKVVEDKFLNNSASPKYFIVKELSEVEYRPGIDHVRVKGLIRPEALPPGVEFERIPDQAASKRRTEEFINAQTPVDRLLELWSKENGCEVPLTALVEEANKLISKASLPTEAIGSLERIDRIALKKITSHEDTSIDLSQLKGLCAVMGPTGAGKTTAMEAILLALYGIAPTHTDLQELVTQLHEGDSLIEMDFVCGGKKYTARREFRRTAKTFTHRAYLFEYGSKDPVAGPKVDDVYNRSCLLVGDPELVLAGVFSCQGHGDDAGDLAEIQPRHRKELFAKLLSTDKFLVIAEMAKEKGQGDNAIIDAYRSRIERLRLEIANDQVSVSVEPVKQEILQIEESLIQARESEQKVRDQMAALSQAQKAHDDANAMMMQLNQRLEGLRTEGKALKAQKEALVAVDVGKLKAAVETAKKARDDHETAQKRIVAGTGKYSAIQASIGQLEAEISALISKRDKDFAEALAKSSQELAEFKARRAEMRQELLTARQKLDAKSVAAAEKLKHAEKSASLIKGIPNVEACKTCVLAKDGIQSKEAIPDLKRAEERAKAAVEKADAEIATFDAETKEHLEAKAKLTPVKQDVDVTESRQTIVDRTEQGKAIQAKLSELLSEAAVLKPQADALPTAEASLEQAQNSESIISTIDTKLQGIRDRFREIQDQLDELVVPDAPNLDAFRAAGMAVHAAVEKLQASLTQKNVELGTIQAKLDAVGAKSTEMEELEQKWRDLNKKVEVWNALTAAFGRDGIPQLIVDSALPHFRDIMAELMRAYRGHWVIDVQTQHETKKKILKEEIHITVDAGLGPRDIRTYSGGEQKILKAVVRIAFAMLQAERSGKGLKVMVFDEALDAMDEMRAEAFIKMIPQLVKSFNQVFVISHNAVVLSTLPNKLVFSKAGLTEPSVVESIFVE